MTLSRIYLSRIGYCFPHLHKASSSLSAPAFNAQPIGLYIRNSPATAATSTTICDAMATITPRRDSAMMPRREPASDYFQKQPGKLKGHDSPLAGFEVKAAPLTVVPEDEPISPDAPNSLAPRRSSVINWGRGISWISDWTFAGSAPVAAPVKTNNEPERTCTPEGEFAKTNGRMSRLRSSITAFSETFVRSTEPSHESNFPITPEFPQTEGKPMTLDVYGSIDSFTADGLRLQLPRGSAMADFTQQTRYEGIMEYMKPKMKDGDMLVRPFMDPYSGDRSLGMVVRGAVQDLVFKCMVVGVFPLKVFGGEVLLESYELDVIMYDPSGSFGL